MLSKQYSIQRDQIEMITLEQLVLANHLVRKIELLLNFSFMYELVEDMYSEVGRPSIEPVILVKLAFIKDESKEMKEITTDPKSGYYVKDERTKQFAYSFHAATDRNGFLLGTIVTPGNTHDRNILEHK